MARRFAVTIAVLFLAESSAVVAQPNPMAGAKGLTCTFPMVATGTWTKGDPQADVKPSTLTLRYEQINTEESTARFNGPFGPADIVVRLFTTSLHLIEIADSGALYVTTVFDKATHSPKLQAVHTRHEYTAVSLPGFTSRPEQYYGECDVVK